MTPEQLPEIARLYSLAPHESYHPSYRAFVSETLWQFRGLLRDGWTFTRTGDKAEGSELAYASSEAMFQDIDRKRLVIWDGGQNFADNSPMGELFSYRASIPEPHSSPSTAGIPKYGVTGVFVLTVNEVFRAVHDVLGHGTTRAPFETMEGEIVAWGEHSKQYSALARPALNGETLGQLAYYHVNGRFVDLQECKVLEL